IEGEIALFEAALQGARQEIRDLGNKLSSDLRPEEMTLFDVYLNILNDDTLGVEVKAKIRDGQWAQGALRQVITHYIGHFQVMDDLYLRERASDILDLGVRILARLQ